MAQVPPLQNACVFCTVRVQFAALLQQSYRQRRLFKSGNTVKKPPAVAVAQENDVTDDITPPNGPEPPAAPNHNFERWKRWESAENSSHADQRWRMHLDTREKNEARGGSSRNQRGNWAQTPPATQLQSPAPHFRSATRAEALAYDAEKLKASQEGGNFWKCQCGQQNPQSNTTACTRCRAPGPSQRRASKAVDPENPSVVQGWKHIQRIGDPENGDVSSHSKVALPETSTTQREFEEARRKRFEQSKGSQFVGLGTTFKRLHLNFDFREVRKNAPEAAGAQAQSIRKDMSPPPAGITKSPQETRSGTSDAHVRREDNSANQQFTPSQNSLKGRDGIQELSEPSSQPERRSGWARFAPAAPQRTFRHPEAFDSPLPIRTVESRSSWTSNDKRADAAVYPTERAELRPRQQDVVTKDVSFESTEASTRPNGRENRMARRLQELEEEQHAKSSKRKVTSARFDFGRESRSSQLKGRKFFEQHDGLEDEDAYNEGRQARRERKQKKKQQQSVHKGRGPPTPIYLPEFISVANLAGALHIKNEEFINVMSDLGFEHINNDHVLDAETAGLIASEFNFEPISDRTEKQDLIARPPAEDKSVLPPRPPVVTIMGHVDHGKTTLLDWLRKSSVAATEHGGITQHIGAFSVPMPSGRTITFLDTPGHAAFLDMRQRGANVTDIVILVVAADDSVKPQTIEAIIHAQAAQAPIIVAINKIDKEDANVDRAKQDLARHGVEIEDYGGDTQVVCVSGKTGQGMETLEESAIALADVLDMRAEVDGPTEGWVLEATTQKAGRVATVLVRRGTLHPGDIIVAGTTWTRVRTLRNEADLSVGSAGPGTPVQVDGWKDQPVAGDEVLQADTEQHARSVINIRLEALERTRLASDMIAVNEARRLEQERREAIKAAEAAAAARTSEDLQATSSEPEETKEICREIPLVVKADVSGSVEAVLASLRSLGNANIRPSIIRSGVGSVSEFDVSHAASAQAHLICFSVGMDQNIRRLAEAAGVKIVEQNIIYRLVDSVKSILESYLEPLRTKRVLGEAEVAMLFDISVGSRRTMPVAGCKVRNGVVERNKKVMVRRNGEVVYDGM